MSNAENLAVCQEAINAIPNDMVIAINIPVDVFVQEAENLYHWSKMDLEQLATAGITEEVVNDLNARAGACREAQSIWIKNHRMRNDAQKKWNEDSPVAYDLRDELIHTFRYAYRDDESLLNRVDNIASGAGNADMIQDLNDEAVMGKENQEPLVAISFDLIKLDTAAGLSFEMADILAIANGSKQIPDEGKVLRDKAYTYLKELVDEIRAAGKYLFWKTPERLAGYSSDYWKRRRSASKKEETPDVEA